MANFAWFSKLHRYLYHHSGGWIGANLGHPMVLMYTIGARTGRERQVPLQYYPVHADGILVLASNNGLPKAPAWYHNLKAHPDITVRVGRKLRRVHAEEVGPADRDALWEKMRRQNPAIEDYAKRAGRVLPIILLRTVRSGGATKVA